METQALPLCCYELHYAALNVFVPCANGEPLMCAIKTLLRYSRRSRRAEHMPTYGNASPDRATSYGPALGAAKRTANSWREWTRNGAQERAGAQDTARKLYNLYTPSSGATITNANLHLVA